jgi:hypothetical protein
VKGESLTPTPEALRSLLLRRLSEDEARRLKEQIAQDALVGERLRDAEKALITDYALSRLGVEDREAFERHLFADAEIRERVKAVRVLHGLEPVEPEPPVHPWDRWPVRVAAVFVVCVLAIPLFVRMNRDAGVGLLSTSKAPSPQAAGDAGGATRGGAAQDPMNVVLLTDIEQASTTRTVHVRQGAPEIRLVAETTSADPSVFYELRVEDESGAWIFSAEDLRPFEHRGRAFVEVLVPASAKLGTGRRVVTLHPQTAGVESFMWQMDVQSAH